MKKPTAVIVRYSFVQTFYQIGTVMIMAVGALSGRLVAPNPESATLPLALSVVGTLAGLFPAALYMKKAGRKRGFVGGSVLGLVGVALLSGGLVSSRFFLFCLGFFVYGLHQAFLQYLRFAAMEAVDGPDRPNALSWILVAGIPAAFLGPLAGLLGHRLFPALPYLGSYGLLFVCLTVQLLILTAIPAQKTLQTALSDERARPLKNILKQADLWVAVLASGLSFALMVMLMAAVPVAMQSHGHAQSDSTLVLQWHVLGMYLPSFFSGFLIKTLGKKPLILIGLLVLLAEAGIALLGFEFSSFAAALILLGIGWNFMYVGGTNLLLEQYRPAEKNKVQALNDIIVFGLTTVASYGAGFLESRIGWFSMNALLIPLLIAAGVAALLTLKRRSTKGPEKPLS